MIGDSIVAIARTYLGQEEVQPNKGFKDPEFESKMKSVGWYVGAPWCSFLGILVWSESYASYPDYLKKAQSLF